MLKENSAISKREISLYETTDGLEPEMFPIIGSRPIADLAAPDLLAVTRRIEGRGAVDVAQLTGHHAEPVPAPFNSVR